MIDLDSLSQDELLSLQKKIKRKLKLDEETYELQISRLREDLEFISCCQDLFNVPIIHFTIPVNFTADPRYFIEYNTDLSIYDLDCDESKFSSDSLFYIKDIMDRTIAIKKRAELVAKKYSKLSLFEITDELLHQTKSLREGKLS